MFASTIKIGMVVQKTLSDIEHLEKDVSLWTMIHNLNEELSTSKASSNGKSYAKTLIKEIEPKVSRINEGIKALNKISTVLKSEGKVNLIQQKSLNKLIRARFNVVAKKDSIELNNENFNLKFRQELNKTRHSIATYIESLDEIQKYGKFSKVSKKYSEQLVNSTDIMSMGIHDVSVFTAGRCVEDIINHYIRQLIKANKIKRIKLKDYKFEAKIGLLKKSGIISEKLFHDLSSVRISRNDTGHPHRNSFSRNEAIDALNNSYSLVQKIEKQIKKLSVD